MNAALVAANSGARVLLLEGGPRLGGQYWRHLPESGLDSWTGQSTYQSDYTAGFLLRNQVLGHPNIEVLCGAQIWSATNDTSLTVNFLHEGVSHTFATQMLILATGAYDRTLPFPGWEIPGVMTPGAAQALLKGSHVLAGKRMVVAGTGPFLLPVADGLSKAGVEIVGLYEAQLLRSWISHWRVAIRNFPKLILGAKYLRRLRQRRGFAVISAQAGANGQLESVRIAKIDSQYRIKEGSEREVRCDAVAVGWGFTPDLSIAQSLGLQQTAGHDGFPVVVVDDFQRTSDPRVFAAGEITGIGGSELSMTEGLIAGKVAADYLKRVESSTTHKGIASAIRRRNRQREFAKTLLRIYLVRDGWRTWLKNATIVCRCEEVTLEEIRESLTDFGATNFRSVKLLTRAGMGACQGKICSRAVIDIIAGQREEVGGVQDYISAGNRPIFAPITLSQLAQLPNPYDAL
jgi:NADPH-dependent 2,4-dienoyl-CoA reductase/sulfur reductase-like enzyme